VGEKGIEAGCGRGRRKRGGGRGRRREGEVGRGLEAR
jgi:hypothetical protein